MSEPFDDEAWQADLDRRADELHGIWLGLVAAWQKWACRPPNREADAGALDDLQMITALGHQLGDRAEALLQSMFGND